MKKTALLAAAAALMTATPALAAGGYVGADYKDIEIATDGEGWEIEGAFGTGGSAGWGFQIDGSVGNVDFGGVGNEGDTLGLAGHAFYTGSGGWRVGGVILSNTADFGAGLEIEDTAFGVEGSFDLGSSAVMLGAFTIGESEFLGADIDTWNLDARINFYPTGNLRLGGTLGVGNLDAGGGADDDTTTIGVDAEWAPFSVPLSFVAGYNHFETDLLAVESDSLSVGIRWNFGGGSVRDRDNAAPFNTRGGFAQRVYDIR